MLDNARLEVAIAARRLDAVTRGMQRDARGLRRASAHLGPGLLLGGGLALGLLAVIVPKSLRGTALVGLGQFLLRRLFDGAAGPRR